MKINLRGAVVSDADKIYYDLMEADCITPSMVLDNLNGEDIELSINSEGGSVFAGLEIFAALKEYPGKVTAHVTGLAASIATIITSAADEVKMSSGAQYMIHNPSAGQVSGELNDLKKTMNALESIKESLIEVYKTKTNMHEDELSIMMDAETWMTAKQAKSFGFVDKIVKEDKETFDNSLVLMNAVNQIKSEGINMNDKKTLLDRIGNLLNKAKEDELMEVEAETQEEVKDEVVETEDNTEAPETEQEVDETIKEVEEDDDNTEIIESMTKSLAEAENLIKELREENESLKNKVETLDKEQSTTAARLAKAKNTLTSLNALMDNSGVFITDQTEQPKKRGRFNH